MYGIDADIPLDNLDEYVIKGHPQEQQDKDTDDNPETSRFEEDNYSEEILIFTAKFRHQYHGDSRQIQSIYKISNTNTLYVLSYMGKFEHVMNDTNNGQSSLYLDFCTDTYILFINYNCFTEVSRTLRSVTMVGFKKDI